MLLNTNFLTEDEYYDRMRMEVLDDNKFRASIDEGVLGVTGLVMLAGLGGALLAKSATKKHGKIRNFFKRIFGKKKNIEFDAIKGKAVVKRELDKEKEFKIMLKDVFNAVEQADWDEAERLFENSSLSDNPDAIKAVALAITDKLGEPPLFVYPSGNETYFVCKKVLGMKYAKALAQSVVVALKQDKSYYKEINLD